jgi:hypothetical protein
MRRIVNAYYSNDLGCWVRLERQEDGEWCHTSGYESREEALGLHHAARATDWVNPCDRREV